MKDDFTTNSHYLIYTFLFRKVGRMYFLNLGVKGLKYAFEWEARRDKMLPPQANVIGPQSGNWQEKNKTARDIVVLFV